MIRRNTRTDKEVASEKASRLMNTIAKWCSWYRENPHRFCADYLNVHLKPFQQILICMMNSYNYFMFLAARGLGKTYLTALFCCVRAILYPGTIICIASGKRGQATEVLNKITGIFMKDSANLRFEISEIVINESKAYIAFKNGSMIRVVTASDNARSARCNILICDEFRMVKYSVIQTVLRKFLTSERQPGYLRKQCYQHLRERNKEIYLSSCWYKSHWSYTKMKAYAANLVDDSKKYFVCGLPYQLSIRDGLLNPEQVADEMSEQDFSEIMWDMEMGCMWYGDTEGSLFTFDDISKTRVLQKAVYPPWLSQYISSKYKVPELTPRERRILSVDVALLASTKHDNDAASIWINSALPTSDNRYIGNYIYTENHEGLLTSELGLQVRRLFEVFHCTDLAIDVRGAGVGVFDCLVRDMYDPLYNVTYPPLNCCNDEAYAMRCTDPTAPRVIWAISASQQFNQTMYLSLREGFRQHRINLLISEVELDDNDGLAKIASNSASERIALQMPFVHTTLLINELINLEYESKGSNIVVYEKSGMRKDRVSSVGYNHYVQCQLEQQLTKPLSEESLTTMFSFRAPVTKKIY